MERRGGRAGSAAHRRLTATASRALVSGTGRKRRGKRTECGRQKGRGPVTGRVLLIVDRCVPETAAPPGVPLFWCFVNLVVVHELRILSLCQHLHIVLDTSAQAYDTVVWEHFDNGFQCAEHLSDGSRQCCLPVVNVTDGPHV